jgi:hypothetical protein
MHIMLRLQGICLVSGERKSCRESRDLKDPRRDVHQSEQNTKEHTESIEADAVRKTQRQNVSNQTLECEV